MKPPNCDCKEPELKSLSKRNYCLKCFGYWNAMQQVLKSFFVKEIERDILAPNIFLQKLIDDWSKRDHEKQIR